MDRSENTEPICGIWVSVGVIDAEAPTWTTDGPLGRIGDDGDIREAIAPDCSTMGHYGLTRPVRLGGQIRS